MNKTVRSVALEVIEKVLSQESYSNIELNRAINNSGLNHKDIGLLTNLVYGVLQHKLTLDFYLQDYLKGKKVDNWVNYLLLMSVYQIEYLDKIPDHAVIYESVEIAKSRGNRGISGFVNGVLRNYQRKGHKEITIIKDETNRLSVQYSVPVWIVQKLTEQLGKEKCLSILKSLNHPSHLSLRVNTNLITVEELKSRFDELEIEVQPSQISPYGLVTNDSRVISLPEFDQGMYTIQDESSMLVAPALQVQKDSQVLDACAAPGGKTTHIASFLDESLGGSITALDIYDHKLKLIEDNARRLQVDSVVNVKSLDATQVATLNQEFDRVLVDAPCSGLGLLRRKPEMRYFKKPSDIDDLTKIQSKILNAAAEVLKVQGILVYSTCTITNEENQQVVDNFISTHENYEQIKVLNDLGKSDDKMVKLYPDEFQTDGFFISAFKRIK
ncbi:16S rRNA (cytosine(967)-C(5))-methyltransferase RsmB [Lactobacillus sp. YT155]|uniref:16S rRNA (cytosine(967)-C(5))-methyltransferase RsmB n=1 Tax=Lactobacillus sp. YT155 TaxID=3060955 RepID=UPI00265F7E63|nr:16S rRNA (cytosine(967)-C(5))-methyltransferase RsmB [Lactobacillus sp. YT155]MDO1605547.1 16S rRNA (cytosine(967)-C(5))-methyltransferase RsmB [Lactobacillus sp. YT155]